MAAERLLASELTNDEATKAARLVLPLLIRFYNEGGHSGVNMVDPDRIAADVANVDLTIVGYAIQQGLTDGALVQGGEDGGYRPDPHHPSVKAALAAREYPAPDGVAISRSVLEEIIGREYGVQQAKRELALVVRGLRPTDH